MRAKGSRSGRRGAALCAAAVIAVLAGGALGERAGAGETSCGIAPVGQGAKEKTMDEMWRRAPAAPVPEIDRVAPARTETATFALG